MEYAIDLRDVAKIYRRRVEALTGIAIRVRPGEIFGLLGPNGAGKTTLVKIMTALVKPTRAAGTVLDKPLAHRGTMARVGYLPENIRFPAYFTGRQAMAYYAALSRVDRATRKRRSAELLERVGLKDWADAKVKTYSKGMQQRLGIAQALVNAPALVILDEPTDGLDPIGRRQIRDLLAELKEGNTTVFINSHLLSELERVCDRAAILVGGTVRLQGTLEKLTEKDSYYEIRFADGRGGRGARDALGAAHIDAAIETTDDGVRVFAADPAAIQPVIDILRRAGAEIHAITPVRKTLEDLLVDEVGQPAPPPLPGKKEAGA